MKTWMSIAVVACAVTLALSVTYVFAQGPAGPPPGGPMGPNKPAGPPHPEMDGALGAPGPDGMVNDKKLREMIETVMMAKLSSQIGLTDEQALQLVRQRAKAREENQKLARDRREKTRELEAAIKSANPVEANVEAKLKELEAIDDKLVQARRQTLEDSGKGLSAVQRAKLYLFINEFENDMRQLVNRVRNGGPGAHGPQPGPNGEPGPQPGMREGGPGGARDGMRGQLRENVRRNLRQGLAHPEDGDKRPPAPPAAAPGPEAPK